MQCLSTQVRQKIIFISILDPNTFGWFKQLNMTRWWSHAQWAMGIVQCPPTPITHTLLPSFAIGFLAAFSSLGLVSRERKDQMKSILGRLRNNFISPLHGQGGDFQVTLPQPFSIQNPGLIWRTSSPPWDLEEWSSQVQYGVRQDFS